MNYIVILLLLIDSVVSWHHQILPKIQTTIKLSLQSLKWKKMTKVTIASALLGLSQIQPAYATDDSSVNMYFGVGCFWHVQHELINAERNILSRSDIDLTSLTGYAGGKSDSNDDLVCYHNIRGVGDYGQKGFSEVVDLTIPKDKVVEFTKSYLNLYGTDGDRPDKGDRGYLLIFLYFLY